MENHRAQKSALVAYGFAIVLPCLGIHQFYLRKIGRGCLWLVWTAFFVSLLLYLYLPIDFAKGTSPAPAPSLPHLISASSILLPIVSLVGLAIWVIDLFQLPSALKEINSLKTE